MPSTVDLPHPEGPSKQRNSPRSRLSEKFLTAVEVLPFMETKDFPTSCNSMKANQYLLFR
jgi:hypothetical protein